MDNEKCLLPIWEGELVYRETMAMILEEGGCSAAFARTPERIVCVESYDGTCLYEEGKDFMIEENRLIRTRDSRIPCTGWETFFYADEAKAKADNPDIGFGPVATSDGRFLNLHAIDNPEYVTRFQLSVTYTTREKWEGFCPGSGLQNLPRLREKLLRREKISLLLYGDSISCGFDCSSHYGLAPNQPKWYDLVVEALEKRSGCSVELKNISLAGMNTDWAIENARQRIGDFCPDLTILGFGMNDRVCGSQYREKTKALMEAVKGVCPETEFLLIATTLPIELADTPPIYFTSHQDEYSDELGKLCEEGVALADVQRFQKALLAKKRYIDMTGNWLNHPNDYLCRIQAQVVNTALGG